MEAEFNVDIVDNDTGEVIAEGLQLSAAHSKIAKMGLKHVETTSEDIPGDGCGGGEEPFVLYTLWVTDPSAETPRQVQERYAKAAKWWDYDSWTNQAN
tara:strand:+ start:219 stop:512 length:294 start_codon:yes stop_codon:yes gene_type:complete